MFAWRSSGTLPIGIQIGSRSVKMLQLRRAKGALEIQAATCAEIPPADPHNAPALAVALTAILQKLLGGGQFQGRQCVTSLAPDLLAAKSLRLPQMPDAELQQAIQWEARDRLGFDPADGQLVFFRAGEVRRGNEIKDEILLFAATGEVLRRHIEQVHAAGLKIHAIDLEPAAMLRAMSRVVRAAPGTLTTLIDIGRGGTQLILNQDDRLAFYKHIEIGSTALDKAVAEKLGVSLEEAAQIRRDLTRGGTAEDTAPASASTSHLDQAVADATRPVLEELARELDMCIRYFVITFRGTRPEQIYLCGAESLCQPTLAFLASSLNTRIQAAQPLQGLADAAAHVRPGDAGDWTAACGLGLYALAQRPLEAAA